MAPEVREVDMFELGEGGGGLNWVDKDVKFDTIEFVVHQFTKKDGSKAGSEQCMLRGVGEVVNPDDPENKAVDIFWPVGKVEHFKPSKDRKTASDSGPFIVLTGDFDKPWAKSAYGVFLKELVNVAGEEIKSKMKDAGYHALNGVVMHLEERKLPKGKNATPDQKEFTTAVPTDIVSAPWDEGAGSSASASAPAASGLDDKGRGYVKTAVAEAGSIKLTDLTKKVFALAASDDDRTAIVQVIAKADWAKANADQGGWLFDEKEGTLVNV